MIAEIPSLHPDELLYSWVARVGLRLNLRYRQDLVRHLWGDENRRPRIDFPLRLEYLAERTEGVIGDGQGILARATLFPLYAVFLPSDRSASIAAGMIDPNGQGSRKVNGLTGLRLKVPPSLRFCSECWKEDDAYGRERYWRRTHQGPGVLVCDRHERPLFYSPVLWAAREVVQEFVAAERVSERDSRKIAVSRNSVAACLDVAVGSRWLLNKSAVLPDSAQFTSAYREGFALEGMVRPGGAVSSELLKFVSRKIGTSLMKAAAGLSRWTSHEWPMLLLRPCRSARGSHSPLRHLLLMSALGHRAESFFTALDQPTLLEKTIAPGKPGQEPARRPLPTCQIRAAEIAQWWMDPSVSVCEMARRLGVAAGTVTLHASRVGLHFPRRGDRGNTWSKIPPPRAKDREQKRDDCRRAFLAYRSRFPAMSQTEMLRAGKAKVRWLQKHDKEWLRQHRCAKTRRGGPPGLDWKRRDREFASKLPEIVNRLTERGKKPSFLAVGRALGISLVNIHRKLPLTSSMVHESRTKMIGNVREKPVGFKIAQPTIRDIDMM